MSFVTFTDCIFDNKKKIVDLNDDNLFFNFIIIISLFLFFIFFVCNSTRKFYIFYHRNGNIIKLPVDKYVIFQKNNKLLALNRFNKEGIEMVLNKKFYVVKFRKLNLKN
tara:strand:- start:279 stop:605 length:327 start_codon:yes stop_codon:yes gene_type:complete